MTEPLTKIVMTKETIANRTVAWRLKFLRVRWSMLGL
jgi:hypothetical protein